MNADEDLREAYLRREAQRLRLLVSLDVIDPRTGRGIPGTTWDSAPPDDAGKNHQFVRLAKARGR